MEIPSFDGMRTYAAWNQLGRHVRRGERAAFYVVSDDGTEAAALFTELQTSKNDDGPLPETHWTRVVAADDRPAPKKRQKDARDALKIEYNTKAGRVGIWVGTSPRGINMLRKAGYKYDGKWHKWFAIRPDIESLVKSFVPYLDRYRLSITIDNEPYELTPEGNLEKELVI